MHNIRRRDPISRVPKWYLCGVEQISHKVSQRRWPQRKISDSFFIYLRHCSVIIPPYRCCLKKAIFWLKRAHYWTNSHWFHLIYSRIIYNRIWFLLHSDWTTKPGYTNQEVSFFDRLSIDNIYVSHYSLIKYNKVNTNLSSFSYGNKCMHFYCYVNILGKEGS